MKKNVMIRAWQIIKEAVAKFGGKCRDYSFPAALKMAWAEAKAPAKQFEQTAKVVISGRENYDDDSASKFLSFNAWEKYGKSRIYINDYKRRTIGYIDRETREYTQQDSNGLTKEQITAALDSFCRAYQF